MAGNFRASYQCVPFCSTILAWKERLLVNGLHWNGTSPTFSNLDKTLSEWSVWTKLVEGTGYESRQASKSETIEPSLMLNVPVTWLRRCKNPNTLSKMADAGDDLFLFGEESSKPPITESIHSQKRSTVLNNRNFPLLSKCLWNPTSPEMSKQPYQNAAGVNPQVKLNTMTAYLQAHDVTP